MATYMIWEGFMDKLSKRMTTVGNKCKRYGMQFTFRETGNEEYRDVKDGEGEIHKLRYVEVEAEGKAQINGWEWLAEIERTENGNLILSANDVEVPNKYYHSDGYCEHCNKNVWRKYLYLVKNTESGEIKQVGRGCLKDYTHGLSAELIAQYRSLFTGLEEAEAEIPSGGYGFYNREYYDAEEVTCFMSETIRHFGFVPRNDEYKTTTSERARDYYDVAHGRHSRFSLCPDRFYKIKAEMEKVGFNAERPESVAEAQQAMAWVAEQDDSRSSYLHNLKTVCSMREVESWHFGILASLLPSWNKSLIREAERKEKAAAEAKSEYAGEVGKRIAFDVASTQIVTSWETDYGMMWLIKFVSTDGNVFMWRASTLHALPDDFELIKSVTGTVKSHEEFRGVKQTFVNRCKVEEKQFKKAAEHEPYNDEAEKALNAAIECLS